MRRHLPECDATRRASWLRPATPAHEPTTSQPFCCPLCTTRKPPQHYLLIVIEFLSLFTCLVERSHQASLFHLPICASAWDCVPNINGSARAFYSRAPPVPISQGAGRLGRHTRLSHVPSLDRRPPASLSSPRPRLLRISRHRLNPRLPTTRATYESPTPSPRPTGLAPRRLGTHSPLFYVKSIFPSVFPASSLPPSGFSIGECLDDLIGSYRGPTPRVDGRAPLDDSRPIVLEDVDRKASRTNSTRHTPGTTEATPETAFCLVASLVYFMILDSPSPSVVSRC